MIVFTCACILLVLGGCALFESGIFNKPPTKLVEVLYDDTDPLSVKPSAQDVISLFDLTNANKFDGLDLRIRKLSSVNLTDIYEQKLPAELPITGDDMRRVAAVKSFKASVNSKINAMSKEKALPQDYSVLYRTIAQELNHMASDEVGKEGSKICLIYSDMEENSQDASFVSWKGYAQVVNDPRAVADKLEKVVPLNDLSGIDVRIIFKPKSHSQEIKFNYYMAVFRTILNRHSARLSVSANATNQ